MLSILFALTACQPATPPPPPVIISQAPRAEPAPAPPAAPAPAAAPQPAPVKDAEGFTMVMGPNGTMVRVKTKDVDVKIK